MAVSKGTVLAVKGKTAERIMESLNKPNQGLAQKCSELARDLKNQMVKK